MVGGLTTITNEKSVVTPEAGVIAILERHYAVSDFGHVTAAIASCFVGTLLASEDHSGESGPADDALP